MVKAIILILVFAIIVNLGRGFFFLLKDQRDADNKRMLHALTWRIGLSVLLFLFIILSLFLGNL